MRWIILLFLLFPFPDSLGASTLPENPTFPDSINRRLLDLGADPTAYVRLLSAAALNDDLDRWRRGEVDSVVVDSTVVVGDVHMAGSSEADTALIDVRLLSVTRSMILGRAGFGHTQFVGEIYFESTKFSQLVRFTDVDFFAYAQFADTEFLRSTSFWDVKFASDADFRGASFTGVADFTRAEFDLGADFSDARFNDAHFPGTANFKYCKFYAFADFSGTVFSMDAEFSEAEFFADTDFGYARFSGGVYFAGTEFSADAEFSEAEFSENTDIKITWAQLHGRVRCSPREYRRFIAEFRQNGDTSSEKACAYDFRVDTRSSIADWMAWLSCGFGYRPGRALLTGLVLVFFFALLFWDRNAIKPRHVTDKEADTAPITFRDALYFSLNTFTTVGYGDWEPRRSPLMESPARTPRWMRWIVFPSLFLMQRFKVSGRGFAVTEGLLGWLVLALFIASLTRMWL